MTDGEQSRRGGWAERPDTATEPLDYVTQVGVGTDGSPLELHLVFTEDGLYVPAIVRRPEGEGPFPTVVCLHGGSGGLGISWLVDQVRNRGAVLDRLLEEGYAVCFTEGRRENEDAYGGDVSAVLDHEDVAAVFDYLRGRPFVDADRIGFFGVSHGGELGLKLASELGIGPAALVAMEPAAIEFLGLRYEGPRREENLQFRDPVTDAQIDLERARERIGRIDDELPILVGGRDSDHLQGLFRKLYELLDDAGKPAEWVSWDYPEHAYQWGPRRTETTVHSDGYVETESTYDPDAIQRETIDRSVAFLNEHIRDR